MNRPIKHSDLSPPTPLWAVIGVTFLASIGTGVVWNGVSFIAKHDYRFTEQQTLKLYALLGITYVIGAMSTGRVLRSLEKVLSPRTALALILTLEAIVCASLNLVHAGWMLTAVSCTMSVLSSWLWPIVESYLTAGRHGHNMRNAIGWWNISWTGATATALVLMVPVMREHPAEIDVLGQTIILQPHMAIVVLGAMHAVALIPLAWFGRWPGAHDLEMSAAAIQSEYPFLLRAARMLLPLSYVFNSAMSPLLPYLYERIHLDQQWETIVTSTWMWVRVIGMTIMWRVGFWHGRWGTLLVGALLMTVGFAMVVTGLSLAVMVVGLGLFGTGMGIVYYAALYYAMSVGRAEVDAGGTHEALIGAGYTVGPLTGLLGREVTAKAQQLGWHLWPGTGVVAVVWLLAGAAAVGVVKPYLAARRLRSQVNRQINTDEQDEG